MSKIIEIQNHLCYKWNKLNIQISFKRKNFFCAQSETFSVQIGEKLSRVSNTVASTTTAKAIVVQLYSRISACVHGVLPAQLPLNIGRGKQPDLIKQQS